QAPARSVPQSKLPRQHLCICRFIYDSREEGMHMDAAPVILQVLPLRCRPREGGPSSPFGLRRTPLTVARRSFSEGGGPIRRSQAIAQHRCKMAAWVPALAGTTAERLLFTEKNYANSEIVLDFTCSVTMLRSSRSKFRGAPSGGAEGASHYDRGGLQKSARNPFTTGTSCIYLSVEDH